MQTDRELLELAAKAAGQTLNEVRLGEQVIGFMWNPLTDDGDALRLAVRLNLCPKRFGDLIEVVAPKGNSFAIVCEQGICNGAMMPAYRRAIVRAAAAIGAAL